MKLRDLHPIFGHIYKDFTPQTGGTPTGNFWLRFDCPKCGHPYTITINIGPGAAVQALNELRWHASILPSPDDIGGHRFLDTITVTPSIGNEGSYRHGPRGPAVCTWHGHITNGEVT